MKPSEAYLYLERVFRYRDAMLNALRATMRAEDRGEELTRDEAKLMLAALWINVMDAATEFVKEGAE